MHSMFVATILVGSLCVRAVKDETATRVAGCILMKGMFKMLWRAPFLEHQNVISLSYRAVN